MITIKTKQRRRVNIVKVCQIVFAFSLGLWLLLSLLIKNEQVNLQVAIQDTNAIIAKTRIENEALAISIQEKSNYGHVANVASESGLENNQSNIITIETAGE